MQRPRAWFEESEKHTKMGCKRRIAHEDGLEETVCNFAIMAQQFGNGSIQRWYASVAIHLNFLPHGKVMGSM